MKNHVLEGTAVWKIEQKYFTYCVQQLEGISVLSDRHIVTEH